jgi:hypothetical protein
MGKLAKDAWPLVSHHDRNVVLGHLRKIGHGGNGDAALPEGQEQLLPGIERDQEAQGR